MRRRHFPGSAEPPVWITLQLAPGSREGRRPQRFSLVTFRVWEPHALSSPQRFPMTDADVAAVAGAPVDRDRGDKYQPWPIEPDPEPTWRVTWTIRLPRPEGMDRGCITTAPPWWRYLARQVIPRRTARPALPVPRGIHQRTAPHDRDARRRRPPDRHRLLAIPQLKARPQAA